jgi:putative DNA-invertase from lambdoid prophage Rac
MQGGESKGVFGQGGMVRAALYTRISTHDQQTLPLQLSALRDYADRRGWKVVAEVQDIASGTSKRPAREELLAAARRRQIDVILVWKLDRWGRSTSDVVLTIKELLDLRVDFVSYTDALDFTTPIGRAMATMLAAFAEFEHDTIVERVKAGIAQARRQGKPHGRPATARAKADQVRELAARKMSKRKIAKELGIGRASVRRILST